MLSRMGRNSAVCFAFATVVLVSGCDSVSGLDTDPKPAEAAATTTASAEQTTPTPTTAAAPATLPDCPEPAAERVDCRARAQDRTGLAFDVRHAPDGTLTIEAIAPDGGLAQTITEQVTPAATLAYPSVLDTDLDGRDELLVPLQADPTATRFAVYHATADAPELTRAGELTALTLESTPDGYLHARSTRATGTGTTHNFWTYESDTLVPVLTVEYTSAAGTSAPGTCTVTTAPGLRRTPYSTVSTARTHFCALATED